MVRRAPTDGGFGVLAVYIVDNVKKLTNDVLHRVQSRETLLYLQLMKEFNAGII